MTYDEAMFPGAFPPDGEFQCEGPNDFAAACTHEAAHAVVAYALGDGVGDLVINATVSHGGRAVAFRGEVQKTKGAIASRDRAMSVGVHTRQLLVVVAVAAAGPIAELEWRRAHGVPSQNPWRNVNDDAAIKQVCRRLDSIGRNGRAFRRLAWHTAQRLIALPDVAEAIRVVTAETILAGRHYRIPDEDGVWRAAHLRAPCIRIDLRQAGFRSGWLRAAV